MKGKKAMRTRTIVLICLMSLLAILPVNAQTGSDNWCYTGGPLEGQCGFADTPESRWMWYYGFYRAQVANGTLTINDLPAEYQVGFGVATSNTGATTTSTATVISTSSTTSSYSYSDDFFAWIAYCEYDNNDDETKVYLGWRNLETHGDEIKVKLPGEGSETRTTTIPLETDKFRIKFDNSFEEIEAGGTVRIYRDDILIAKDSLNSIYNCDED
jgi:hypothetical protein